LIPFNFSYHKPESIKEAAEIFQTLDSQGKQPLYYGGGTEIISMARTNNIHTSAVIDIKSIPECNVFGIQNDDLIIGAAVTLSQISESNLFPLLGKSGGRVADHTIQCKITLGGNIGGTIIYREAVLPLLLSDSQLVIAGIDGIKQLPISDLFNERLRLGKGEFLLQAVTKIEYTSLPYVHVKKTKQDKIDYPLITITALKKEDRVRVAFSGLCSYPFRSLIMEEDLNSTNIPLESRISNAISHIPGPIVSDTLGSADYRKFVLSKMLSNTLNKMGAV